MTVSKTLWRSLSVVIVWACIGGWACLGQIGVSNLFAQEASTTDTKTEATTNPSAEPSVANANETSVIGVESPVIVKIQDIPYTAEKLRFDFHLRTLKQNAPYAERLQVLNKLIDAELIRQFLIRQAVPVQQELVDQQIAQLEEYIVSHGGEPAEVFQRYNLTRDNLADMLWAQAAWETFTDLTLTRSHYTSEWETRRSEYDGTRVKAAQIVILLPPDAPTQRVQEATEELMVLRRDILAGKLSFTEAAKKHSQSPSAERGGDLGEFTYRGGRVDPAISEIAFMTPVNEISLPIRTRFGVHLVNTEKRLQGDLSLEDSREEIRKKISNVLWNDLLLQERKRSKVEILYLYQE